MKRLFAFLLAVSLVMCLCACGGSGAGEDPAGPNDVTTKPTEKVTEPAVEAADPTYVVTVVDQDNLPVAGAWVQLCLESCVPAMTDENGVANFFLEENDYKVSFTVMPVGYEYSSDEQEWYFADGENTMTIVLKKSV